MEKHIVIRKQKSFPGNKKVKLEKVLGTTILNNLCLSTDQFGNIAYTAGCVVVLYNPKRGRQSQLFNNSKKTLTCLSYSKDGKFLVTGECGHQPAVRVWNIVEESQFAEFNGHSFGLSCVAFSPNMKYIVSIGSQYDMMVNVWDWRAMVKVASNKNASKISDLAFSEDGSMFVTVGIRHVKFWYMESTKSKVKSEISILQGRNGILGQHQNNMFCGVVCGKGQKSSSTYVICEGGLLTQFNEQRMLIKWLQFKSEKANCISCGEKYLFVGFNGGVCRIFCPLSLIHLASVPFPHPLGLDVTSNLLKDPGTHLFADLIAIQYNDLNNLLTCIYNDHSTYIWDTTDIKKIGKIRSFLFHSGPIWGIDIYPKTGTCLPLGSFATCGNDRTIRIWQLSSHNVQNATPRKKNLHSSDLVNIIYIDNDFASLLDTENQSGDKNEKVNTNGLEKCGIRCLKFSPNGNLLASGDRSGNVRIHELTTMKQIVMVEAHDSQILTLEFTDPLMGRNVLASAGKDRLIHLYDVDNQFQLLQTLDDHSSAITAVKFLGRNSSLYMLSCAMDKSILFRVANLQETDFKFNLSRHLANQTALYDMEIDKTGEFVATSCHDRNIRIYSIETGRLKKTYSGSTATDGTLLRISLDPSGRYFATSCSDKSLNIVEFATGEFIATMYGHSEMCSGVKFLNDYRHLISVSANGCIFIWRIPDDISDSMQYKASQTSQQSKSSLSSIISDKKDSSSNNEAWTITVNENEQDEQDNLTSHFSIDHYPDWAQKIMSNELNENSNDKDDVGTPKAAPTRRQWAKVEGVNFDNIICRQASDALSPEIMQTMDDDDDIQSLSSENTMSLRRRDSLSSLCDDEITQDEVIFSETNPIPFVNTSVYTMDEVECAKLAALENESSTISEEANITTIVTVPQVQLNQNKYSFIDEINFDSSEDFEATLRRLEGDMNRSFDSHPLARKSLSARYFHSNHKPVLSNNEIQNTNDIQSSKAALNENKKSLDLNNKSNSTIHRKPTRFSEHNKEAIKPVEKKASNTASPNRKWKSMLDVSNNNSVLKVASPEKKITPSKNDISNSQLDLLSFATLPKSIYASKTQLNLENSSKPVNRVKSYRMQTKSSLAKTNDIEIDPGKFNTRRSLVNQSSSKFQSNPNLITKQSSIKSEQSILKPSMDGNHINKSSNKNIFISSGNELDYSNAYLHDNAHESFNTNRDSNHNLSNKWENNLSNLDKSANKNSMIMMQNTTLHHSSNCDESINSTSDFNSSINKEMGNVNNNDAQLMPPPLSTSIPSNIIDSFLMKADRHTIRPRNFSSSHSSISDDDRVIGLTGRRSYGGNINKNISTNSNSIEINTFKLNREYSGGSSNSDESSLSGKVLIKNNMAIDSNHNFNVSSINKNTSNALEFNNILNTVTNDTTDNFKYKQNTRLAFQQDRPNPLDRRINSVMNIEKVDMEPPKALDRRVYSVREVGNPDGEEDPILDNDLASFKTSSIYNTFQTNIQLPSQSVNGNKIYFEKQVNYDTNYSSNQQRSDNLLNSNNINNKDSNDKIFFKMNQYDIIDETSYNASSLFNYVNGNEKDTDHHLANSAMNNINSNRSFLKNISIIKDKELRPNSTTLLRSNSEQKRILPQKPDKAETINSTVDQIRNPNPLLTTSARLNFTTSSYSSGLNNFSSHLSKENNEQRSDIQDYNNSLNKNNMIIQGHKKSRNVLNNLKKSTHYGVKSPTSVYSVIRRSTNSSPSQFLQAKDSNEYIHTYEGISSVENNNSIIDSSSVESANDTANYIQPKRSTTTLFLSSADNTPTTSYSHINSLTNHIDSCDPINISNNSKINDHNNEDNISSTKDNRKRLLNSDINQQNSLYLDMNQLSRDQIINLKELGANKMEELRIAAENIIKLREMMLLSNQNDLITDLDINVEKIANLLMAFKHIPPNNKMTI